ncbi:MAG: V-type ATP synthase subunit I [candidate division WOR-3 bacterium]
MAIDRVSKFVIAVHQSNKDEFLARLQQLGVFHITRSTPTDTQPQDRTLAQLLLAIEVLSANADKKFRARINLVRREYEQLAVSYDPQEQLAKIESIIQRKNELWSRDRELTEEIRRLAPWRNLDYAPSELAEFIGTKFLLGRFDDRTSYETVQKQLVDKPAACWVLSEDENGLYVLIAVAAEFLPAVTTILSAANWQREDLRGLTRPPAEAIQQLEQEQRLVREELAALQEEMNRLVSELPRMKVKADALLNEIIRREVETQVSRTDSVILLYGWIRNRDIQKLEQLVEESGVAAMVPVAPEPGEQPPVALSNPRLWRPFELVLELYQLPVPDEMDPTWLIAPFFGVFFGLCLTDAGYGLVLAVITLMLMRRLGFDNKLLGIILIGALLTIPAGAMVGGWFGDLPDRLGLGWLLIMKNRLMLFDPMKEPLKFFFLSLALGYIQLISGIAFEIADCLRRRQFSDGLLGQLPWFVLLNSIVLRLLLGRNFSSLINSLLVVLILLAVAAIVVFTRREKETMISQWLWFGLLGSLFVYLARRMHWVGPEFDFIRLVISVVFWGVIGYGTATVFLHHGWNWKTVVAGIVTLTSTGLWLLKLVPAIVPGLSGIIFYFIAPSGRRLLTKFIWGGYAVYSATSYIGVLLSYIRLMALGMCTGGVAMAINVIAWMVLSIPVVGVILALLVLIIGHGYNIAVNVLGAFVHSLRLQYVEFFPRFYTGGGEPFKPFREVSQFVVLKS